MRRIGIILGLLLLFVSPLFWPILEKVDFAATVRGVLASAEFETTYEVRYQVLPTGITHVSQNISLTNKLSHVYATHYSLTFQGGQIENVTASDKEGPLKIEIEKGKDQTKIGLVFNEKVAGKGKTLNFSLAYDVRNLANKIGQIWEITIPKISEASQIDQYTLTLAVPQSFGKPAFFSPNPIKQTQEKDLFIYHFTKNQLLVSGVNAAFGQFQIFDFVLSYHLKNPHSTPVITEIALPPDTAYQRVFFEKVDPPPLDVEIDPDGNWLASYRLEGEEKLDITAIGKAKIFSEPFKLNLQFSKNLDPQPYWQVDHPLIQKKAKELKTPKRIYDFVVQTLDYDFSRVKEGSERLGALQALKNPQQAICMEFTDLFIALARAAGIPAREINGYAYTTNPKLRPLSLLSDVLHSWPEYWDEKKQVWIPVDPTWEKTTGGIDYFSKIDLNHFVLAIHGLSSEKPYAAGSYKTDDGLVKDVQIVFGQYQAEKPPQIEVRFEVPREIFFELKRKGKIIVKNKGPSSVYNLGFQIEAVGLSFDSLAEKTITSLPPFGQEEIPLFLSSQPFKLGQGRLTVALNGQQFSQSIKLKSLLLEKILPLFILVLFLTFPLFRVKKRLRR